MVNFDGESMSLSNDLSDSDYLSNSENASLGWSDYRVFFIFLIPIEQLGRGDQI